MASKITVATIDPMELVIDAGMEDLIAKPQSEYLMLRPAELDSQGFLRGYVQDLPDADYHARRPMPGVELKWPVVTQSIIKYAVHETMAHCKLSLDGKLQRKKTKALAKGSLLHAVLFGRLHEVVVVDYHSYQPDAAQKIRDAAYAVGRCPVLRHEFEEILVPALNLRDWLLRHYGLDVAKALSEVSVYWTVEVDGATIQCQGRLDLFFPPPLMPEFLIADLKNPEDASTNSIQRDTSKYSYEAQPFVYGEAVRVIEGLSEHPRFEVIHWEKPTGLVNMTRFDAEAIEDGRVQWELGLTRIARALRTGDWPGHVEPGKFNVITSDPYKSARLQELSKLEGLGKLPANLRSQVADLLAGLSSDN